MLLIEACSLIARPEIRKLMTRLIGPIPDAPKLIDVYRDAYYLPRRLALLAKDIDLEALADMLIGALMYRLLILSPADNQVQELRSHVIKLLRQAGFAEFSRVHITTLRPPFPECAAKQCCGTTPATPASYVP